MGGSVIIWLGFDRDDQNQKKKSCSKGFESLGVLGFLGLGTIAVNPSLRKKWSEVCFVVIQIFCLEHRSYKSHNCSKATVKDSTVLICPICAATVKTVFGEDPNLTMEKHSQTANCDPNNYAKVMKKPKCPVKGCHELLTFSNKMTCKSCNKATCVRHRFPADHACVIKSGTAAVRDLKQPARTFAGSKFLEFLAGRNGSECGTSSTQVGSSLRNSDKQIDKEKIPTIKP